MRDRLQTLKAWFAGVLAVPTLLVFALTSGDMDTVSLEMVLAILAFVSLLAAVGSLATVARSPVRHFLSSSSKAVMSVGAVVGIVAALFPVVVLPIIDAGGENTSDPLRRSLLSIGLAGPLVAFLTFILPPSGAMNKLTPYFRAAWHATHRGDVTSGDVTSGE